MKLHTKCTMVILLAITSHSAVAAFVDGREWMQVTISANFSYDEMSALCDVDTGACVGQFAGWKWATSHDVAYLFDTYQTNSYPKIVGNDFYHQQEDVMV